jgi:Tfp pilus assembly protein PilV
VSAPVKSRQGRRGLTLVEVVFASGVLSIIMLGVFSALSSAQRADMITRERQAVSEKAAEMLDAMLAYDAPPAGTGVAVAFDVTLDLAGTIKLKPAPDDATVAATWAWSLDPSAPSTPTMGGVAAVRAGVDTRPGSNDAAGNTDLLEARVVFAWHPADGQGVQRVELVSRRIR